MIDGCVNIHLQVIVYAISNVYVTTDWYLLIYKCGFMYHSKSFRKQILIYVKQQLSEDFSLRNSSVLY